MGYITLHHNYCGPQLPKGSADGFDDVMLKLGHLPAEQRGDDDEFYKRWRIGNVHVVNEAAYVPIDPARYVISGDNKIWVNRVHAIRLEGEDPAELGEVERTIVLAMQQREPAQRSALTVDRVA